MTYRYNRCGPVRAHPRKVLHRHSRPEPRSRRQRSQPRFGRVHTELRHPRFPRRSHQRADDPTQRADRHRDHTVGWHVDVRRQRYGVFRCDSHRRDGRGRLHQRWFIRDRPARLSARFRDCRVSDRGRFHDPTQRVRDLHARLYALTSGALHGRSYPDDPKDRR